MTRIDAITLSGAILFEVAATSALKASHGLTRPLPVVITGIGYLLTFLCMSMTLRSVPVGIVYAIWSGVGIVLLAIIGRVVYDERLDAAALVGMGLILAGVLVLNLSKTTTGG